MENRFVCPRRNEIVDEAGCRAAHEYAACRDCISPREAARGELFMALQQQYGGRLQIALEKGGVHVAVREGLTLLADPCDWREDPYVGVNCGPCGETHTHPQDVFRWLESYLAGDIVFLLTEGEYGSVELAGEERSWWSDWDEATWAVDAQGTYPAVDYPRLRLQ